MDDSLRTQGIKRPVPVTQQTFDQSRQIVSLPHLDTKSSEIAELPAIIPSPTQNHVSSLASTRIHEWNRKIELVLPQRSQSFSQNEALISVLKLPLSELSPKFGSDERKGSHILSQSLTPGQISTISESNGTQSIHTNALTPTIGKLSPYLPLGSALLRSSRGAHASFPPISDPRTAPIVEHAPASGMYWSTAPLSGSPHTGLRAHASTLIGSNIYVFGGCDSKCCFNELYVLDADAFYLSCPFVYGEIPVPLRAMTCTAVGKKLVIFGGGDGPAYYNDVYVLDTMNFRWSKPKVGGDRQPSKRRAHTACFWRNGIYIFGGGDGVRALNDVWRLDVADTNKMSWKLISPPSAGRGDEKNKPKARGYHTANMVGSKLIIFGGSDGGECFQDVWVFDVEALTFSPVNIHISYPRLSHTATIVGSYLFVIGGHDGVEYCNEVLLLNLVTMVWDKRRIYGQLPQPRGYHTTVLHDSRLIVMGGFDGHEVFSDVRLLELAVHAYYSQISHFSIDV
ncbi:unnamed protein product [Blumeria hordei]|uniref:Attractin/MKLN-like beta-propeller domain-containing protein n=1 Tax=Blumeria hordei TaxID=2867405 RepID=A0A383V011_BLUHO|nr:unnamed protein product [Blumeria hordei]